MQMVYLQTGFGFQKTVFKKAHAWKCDIPVANT